VIAFSVLALCVFLWGLEYKMSLYEPPHATSRQLPEAKLLSENEQPDRSADAARAQGSLRTAAAFPFSLLLFALSLFAMSAARFTHRAAAAPEFRRLYRALLRSFFVRPPPRLV
jgi:hypothetical protein